MVDDPRKITFIGTTDFRNSNVNFGIRAKDRLRHTYIIGSTGVGKSFLIENMVIQDIQSGNGIALLDPHGGTAEKMLKYIPEDRIQDVIYFAPHDLDYPIGFNPLEDPGPDFRSQVSDGMLTAFKKIWVDAFSARMEYVLSNTLLALLEYPNATLLSVNRMLADKKFREKVVNNVKDPSVRSVWVDEFMKWEDKFAREAFSSIQNKVGQFTANPMIRNILGQPRSTLDFREMMDTRKIFIANLSKGRVGEQNAPLIGAMLITKIYLAAMSRADKSEYEMNFLPPFYLYVDEFQNFANDSFENILSESRKYKLGLIVAHQYIAQMPETIQNAVFGNVGTKIVFRTQKPEDAEVFEKAFTPVFTQTDIMNLGLAQIYLTLLIDGVGSMPFSAKTIRQVPPPIVSFEVQAVAASRQRYTRPRADVEAEISEWFLSDAQSPVARSAQQSQSQAQAPQRNQQYQPQQQSSGYPADQDRHRSNNQPQPNNARSPERATSAPDNRERGNNSSARDSEHVAYLEQKRKEVESRGGVWLSPDEYKSAKESGNIDQVMQQKRADVRAPVQQSESARQSIRRPDDRPAATAQQSQVSRPREREQAPVRETRSDDRPPGANRVNSDNNTRQQIPPTPQQKRNDASSGTRNSLRDLLKRVQENNVAPTDRVTPVAVSQKFAPAAARQPRELEKDAVVEHQQANVDNRIDKDILTRNKTSAVYTHENTETVPATSKQVDDGVPINESISGWNQISPADLASALGTKL